VLSLCHILYVILIIHFAPDLFQASALQLCAWEHSGSSNRTVCSSKQLGCEPAAELWQQLQNYPTRVVVSLRKVLHMWPTPGIWGRLEQTSRLWPLPSTLGSPGWLPKYFGSYISSWR